MPFFNHSQSLVETDNIGDNTRIWAFTHVLPGAVIGTECNICDNVFIENDVIIGNRVTIKCGVQIWDGLRIEDDVFIGPNATFTNDFFPRSKQYPDKFVQTTLKAGASIGANATILAGITIGRNAMIGAGAVVTRDVPPNTIVVGNPAKISGYVSTINKKIVPKETTFGTTHLVTDLPVKGVTVYKLPLIKDLRGSLSFAEINQYLPFEPKRYFIVFDVASKEVRGEHAHKTLHQFLVCVKGSCSLLIDDGHVRDEILLDQQNIGVHIPPMIWGVQYKYSPDAVLLVLASDIYSAADYIRDYDEFLSMVASI